MWLPGQRLDQWLESVDALIDTGPEHASLYLLEIYPNAPLRDDGARRMVVAPTTMPEMYCRAGPARSAGYEQYEISNVARPGRQSRHNLKYWQGSAWLGFGCAAHSTWDGIRWRNVSVTGEYVGRVLAGASARASTTGRCPTRSGWRKRCSWGCG